VKEPEYWSIGVLVIDFYMDNTNLKHRLAALSENLVTNGEKKHHMKKSTAIIIGFAAFVSIFLEFSLLI